MTIVDGWLNGAAQPSRRFLFECVLVQASRRSGSARGAARGPRQPRGSALQIAGLAPS